MDCDTYGDACDPVAGRSKMRRDLRLSIFSILPFPLSEKTRGRISERSGNVEGPGALLTSKQIFFGGNAKVGAGLFAGEIELNTCCVAMVKLLGESCRVVDGSGAPDWPKSTLAILVLSLLEWTGCRAGVQAIVARQN